jgi:hypothetical protein
LVSKRSGDQLLDPASAIITIKKWVSNKPQVEEPPRSEKKNTRPITGLQHIQIITKEVIELQLSQHIHYSVVGMRILLNCFVIMCITT